jgi:hypothetical protein
MLNRKAIRQKMNKKISKITNHVIILAAALGLVLSPTVVLANPEASSRRHHTQVVRHPARQTVQFQGREASMTDWDHDADRFYTPTWSPNFDNLIH